MSPRRAYRISIDVPKDAGLKRTGATKPGGVLTSSVKNLGLLARADARGSRQLGGTKFGCGLYIARRATDIKGRNPHNSHALEAG